MIDFLNMQSLKCFTMLNLFFLKKFDSEQKLPNLRRYGEIRKRVATAIKHIQHYQAKAELGIFNSKTTL